MEITPKLGLHKQKFGDNPEMWGDYEREDKVILDEVLGGVRDEISKARGSRTSLDDRLSRSIYSDGTLRTPEEVIQAREPFVSLRDSMARRSSDWVPNSLNIAPNTDNDRRPDFLVTSGMNAIVDIASGPIIFDINGYTQIIDEDMSLEDRTVRVPLGGTYYLYAARGSSKYPILGYSSRFGEEGDAVYFGEVTAGDTEISNSLLYRIKRRYSTPWSRLAINPSEVQPPDPDYPWRSELTLSHYLGTIPTNFRIIAAKPNSGDSPGTIYIPSVNNFIIEINKTNIRISANTLSDYLFLSVDGGNVRKWDHGRIKIFVSY